MMPIFAVDTTDAQWITLATLIVGFIAKFVQDYYQRKWAKEDRDEAARQLATKVEAESVKLGKAVKENTEITTRTLIEATGANEGVKDVIASGSGTLTKSGRGMERHA